MTDAADRRSALEARRARLSAPAREALDARVRGAAAAPERSGVLVCLREGAARPLFCVHPAWGDVLAYAPLAERLDRPFYGLQSPILAGEPAPDGIEAMAERYVAAITEVDPDGPHLIGGWSFGGLVAFEMGRLLAARGRPPALVALVDSELGDGSEEHADREAEIAQARRLLGAAATPERLARMLAALDANLAALSRWRPLPLRAPVALLRRAGGPPSDGWRRVASPLSVEEVEGDHFGMVAEPAVGMLASRLAAAIAAVEGP